MSNQVTVIIPCYNDGPYIQEAVDSILNQTFTDYNIVIIDDGSNDATRTILAQLDYENVAIYYQDNHGVSHARNFGINLSESEYILTLDADDYFEPTFLEKAIKILNTNEDVAVVGCYYYLILNREIQHIVRPKGGTIKNFLTKNEGLGNALFRKQCWEAVGGHDEQMKAGYEDWEFWIAILAKGWNMKIIQEPLFNYRIKENSRDQKALKEHDLELKLYILSKHLDVYKMYAKDVIASLLENNNKLFKRHDALTNSFEYKLGKFLIRPLKLIKRLLTFK